MTRTHLAYLTIAILTVLLSGCTSEDGDINDNPNAGTATEQYETLLQRPHVKDVTENYKQFLNEVKTKLRERFELPQWEYAEDENISSAGCGFDFPDVHLPYAVTRTIGGGFTRAEIPSNEWDEAVKLVSKIARKYKFAGPNRVAYGPGNREVQYHDVAGSTLSWGQVDNMSVSIRTGCFLTPEAHHKSATRLANSDP